MKTRIIHTKFWNDSFILSLNPTEKLLFIYLLTNEQVNIIHLYECPDERILFDTGIDRGILQKAKDKFEKAGKIYFKNSYIYLKNSIKYEEYKGELHDKARKNIIKSFSNEIKSWYNSLLLNKTPLRPLKDPLKGTETIIHNKETINNKDNSIISKYSTNTNKIAKLLNIKPTSSLEKLLNKTYPDYFFKQLVDTMLAWCEDKNKQPSVARLVNWANKDFNKGILPKK